MNPAFRSRSKTTAHFQGVHGGIYAFEGLAAADALWQRWMVRPAARRNFEFSNLSEGSYRFEARTINTAGLASEPSVFAFRILPPWYRSGWPWPATSWRSVWRSWR